MGINLPEQACGGKAVSGQKRTGTASQRWTQEGNLAHIKTCPSLPTLTLKTSWAARPPMKALMGARSPAATYANFRMSSSSSLSCWTAGKARAFTACARVTSSDASSWWPRRNQERTYYLLMGARGTVENGQEGMIGLQARILHSPPTHLPHYGAEVAGCVEHRTDVGPGSQCADEQGENIWQNLLSQSLAQLVRSVNVSVERRISRPVL